MLTLLIPTFYFPHLPNFQQHGIYIGVFYMGHKDYNDYAKQDAHDAPKTQKLMVDFGFSNGNNHICPHCRT